MTLSKKNLNNVMILTAEVAALTAAVDLERQNVSTVEYDKETGRYERSTEERNEHPGYTKASAALRRRSMDLSRALAELRRSR